MTTTALPRRTYLNHEFGIKSWLLTKDHKRIGLMYLVLVTLAFMLGGFSPPASAPSSRRRPVISGRRTPTTSCSRCTAS
jgi:hypothetical protein